MTKVLTVRLSPQELAQCDAWAKELGVTRTDFVRSRLFDPATAPADRERKRFASRDLIGSLAVGSGSTNEQVRSAMRKKAAR
jgi:hypothetical protein